MARIALFVIDIQVELAKEPETQIPHAQRIREVGTALLGRARGTIDAARSKGQKPDLEIVIVQHNESPEEGTLVKGSKPWELVFPPRKGDPNERVVHKTTHNTFDSNPELAAQLKARGVEKIVAIGIESNHCVKETSKGALAAGFPVVLLEGAHSTYDTTEKKAVEIERAVEEELRGRGVEVIPWAQWMF